MSNIQSGEMFDYYECQAVTVVVHVVHFSPFSWLRHVSFLGRVSMAGCQRILVCGCGLKQITPATVSIPVHNTVIILILHYTLQVK